MNYNELTLNKFYGEMTPEEKALCIEVETERYKNKVQFLKDNNIEDYRIAAFFHDLWHNGILCDDTITVKNYGISIKDWKKGIEYYLNNKREINPLLWEVEIRDGKIILKLYKMKNGRIVPKTN